MKSLITPAPKTPAVNPYPCLKQWKTDKGFVVLFTASGCGIVVAQGNGAWKIGAHCGIADSKENWCEKEFIPFDGQITLSN